MIELARGSLFEVDVEALVNTVNCDGFMGKGVALDFRKKYRKNLKFYEESCVAGKVMPGRMLVFETEDMYNPKYIINFPTKRHWRGKSRLEDIDTGLVDLVEEVRRRCIRSIAIPPLGCGLGGLNWSDVRPRIERAFSALPDVRVLLYEPEGVPAHTAHS